MKKLQAASIFSSVLALAACVTINVYFPAAAAEKAAEKFVGDVLAEPREEGSLFDPRNAPGGIATLAASKLLDFLVPSAQAQQAQIDINTPQINAIKARMSERQRQSLSALFDAGAIGFTADGLVSIRDRAAVPLSERRSIETLVADENRDRKAVYREIAVANGHPEWEQDIQETFAREWVRNARPGWYYQEPGGAWRQK
ncbi:MAG TPA: YdbL family protein [Xanthomonadales bacterium]|nr:YdbL family protein [Xanthomonadales bacterium]